MIKGEMRKIPLTQGRVALVSNEDYDLVAKYRWSVTGKGYVAAYIDGRMTYMHRFLLGLGSELMTDHINRDRLDNRRENLRPANAKLNAQNRPRRNGKGYSWDKQREKYRARIRINGRQTHLGLYDNEYQARRAYQEALSMI